jgi:hypothetical protein
LKKLRQAVSLTSKCETDEFNSLNKDEVLRFDLVSEQGFECLQNNVLYSRDILCIMRMGNRSVDKKCVFLKEMNSDTK